MNLDPNDFERALRSAVKREDAPASLLPRVLDRIPEQRSRWTRWRLPLLGLTFAVLLLAVNLEVSRRGAERARGEAAKKQLLQALQITGRTLQIVENKVNQSLEIRR